MNINDALEMFNNGDFEIIKYFNDYETFFKMLEKRGLLDEIDPMNAVDSQNWQNEWMLFMYQNNIDVFNSWIDKFFSDVVFENGEPLLVIQNRGDLSELFSDDYRNGPSKETIENILSEDGDFWEPYWETTDDVYRDVIEELTPENKKRLEEYVFETLKGQKIESNTDFLESLSEEQGHPEYVEITLENVGSIINNEETMENLLKNELSDLKSELYNIHSNAYNSAYESDAWDEIWRELNKYFIGHGEFFNSPNPRKKDTIIQKFKIQIRDFYTNVIEYLEDNKSYGISGTLEYIGSYLGMLVERGEFIRVHFPDYPDFRKVDKNINEYFTDYI